MANQHYGRSHVKSAVFVMLAVYLCALAIAFGSYFFLIEPWASPRFGDDTHRLIRALGWTQVLLVLYAAFLLLGNASSFVGTPNYRPYIYHLNRVASAGFINLFWAFNFFGLVKLKPSPLAWLAFIVTSVISFTFAHLALGFVQRNRRRGAQATSRPWWKFW